MSDTLIITTTITVVPRTVYDVVVSRATTGGGRWSRECARPVATCDQEETAKDIQAALLDAEREKYSRVTAKTAKIEVTP